MANVLIPTPLRSLVGGLAEMKISGATVQEVLENLVSEHEGMEDRLFDSDGKLRRFVNVFVRDEDIRFLDGTATSVEDGDTVSVVPAVAGG